MNLNSHAYSNSNNINNQQHNLKSNQQQNLKVKKRKLIIIQNTENKFILMFY